MHTLTILAGLLLISRRTGLVEGGRRHHRYHEDYPEHSRHHHSSIDDDPDLPKPNSDEITLNEDVLRNIVTDAYKEGAAFALALFQSLIAKTSNDGNVGGETSSISSFILSPKTKNLKRIRTGKQETLSDDDTLVSIQMTESEQGGTGQPQSRPKAGVNKPPSFSKNETTSSGEGDQINPVSSGTPIRHHKHPSPFSSSSSSPKSSGGGGTSHSSRHRKGEFQNPYV